MMNNLTIFEGTNVEMMIGENNEPLFELYSVGKALGYSRWNGRRTSCTPHKTRIDQTIVNADIEPCVHAGHKYLTEEMIYDFMFEARTDKCRSFRKWLSSEVLPSIRQNGCYVAETITDQQQELLVKYGMPRYRKNTFLTVPVEQLEAAYKECMEYHRKKSAPERIKVEKEIVAALTERKEAALINGSAPLALMIETEAGKIQKNITTRSNRSYGNKLARANKQLNEANKQLTEAYDYIDYFIPDGDEYICLDMHGFSVNAQYMPDVNEFGTVRTDFNGKPRLRRTDAYNKWLNDFATKMDQLDLNINFENGVDIYLYFSHLEKFDCHNFHKSFFDAISKYYNVDDKNFHLKSCDTSDFVNSYDEGKIFFCIRERQA